MKTAELILRRAAETGPRCGAATVIAIDGPSGSGKTTLATRVAGAARTLVDMDDLYPGWTGLREGGQLLHEGVLVPISRGEPGEYQRYDWHIGARAETHRVEPTGVIIVEGVGSVRTEFLDLLSLIVFVDEPDEAARRARVIERDGPGSAGLIGAWMIEEAALHAEVGTLALADLVIDGSGHVISDDQVSR